MGNEIDNMKIKDLFETESVLSGRSDSTTIEKIEGRIWSCTGHNFSATNPEIDAINYASNGVAVDSTTQLWAPVFLPDRAEITAIVVFGADATETWQFETMTLDGGASTNTTAGTTNTEETGLSIKIDNQKSGYFIFLPSLDSSDQIYGARITYTS